MSSVADRITREKALEAFDNLNANLSAEHQASLTVLAEYMGQVEGLTNRLANHASRVGHTLEVGKEDLIRFGWDRCAEAASVDPHVQKALKAAFPYEKKEDPYGQP